MKHLLKSTALLAVLAPFAASAQTDFSSILGVIGGLVNTIIPILIAAAIAYFIYGVVRFVIASDADDKGKARSIVIQGIIGLFVIVSVWGLVGVIQNSFGLGTGGSLSGDQIPGVQLNP